MARQKRRRLKPKLDESVPPEISEGRQVPEPILQRRVNTWLVVGTFGVLVALGAVVHVVHASVVAATAEQLLNRARALEEDDPSAAVRYYAQYLRFEPRDTEALLRLGRLLDTRLASPATQRRVYLLYESVVNAAGSDDFDLSEEQSREIRGRLVDLLIRFNRYEDAIDPHLLALQENARDRKDRGDLAAQFAREGLCRARLREIPGAVGAYVRASSLDDAKIEYHAALAELLARPQASRIRRTDLPTDDFVASELLDLFPDPELESDSPPLEPDERVARVLCRLVERGNPRHQALLTRAVLLVRRGNESLDDAWNDLLAAREVAPEETDPSAWLLTAIEIKLAQARALRVDRQPEQALAALEEANAFVDEGLRQDPPNLAFFLERYRIDRTAATLSTPEELADRMQSALDSLSTGIEETRQRAEQARGTKAATLSRLEHDLRWAFCDLQVDVATLDAADRKHHLEQAEEGISALDEAGYDLELLEFLRARIAFEHGTYARTLALLEQVRPLLSERRDLQRRIDLLLGRCYSALSNDEARYRTFARALVDDPNWSLGRIQFADALAQLGRFDSSIEEYLKLGNASIVPLAVAEVELLRLRRLPEDRRNFRRLESALGQAEKLLPDSGRVAALWAEMLFLTGQREAAGQRLDDALVKNADDPALRAARVQFSVRSGQLDEAERLLADALEELGPRRELVTTSVALAVARATEAEKESALDEVETLIGRTTGDDRRRLLHTLAAANQSTDDPDESARTWTRIADEFPSDLSSRMLLFQAADEANRDRWLAEIARVEGQGGPNASYLRAQWWFDRHDGKVDGRPVSEFRQVRDWLVTAAEQRPGWAAPHRLRGQLEDQRGRSDVALREYERAFELGDHSGRTVAYLLQAYYRQQQFEDMIELNRRLVDDAGTILSEEFESRIGQINRLAEWQQQEIEQTRTKVNRLAADSDQAAVARPALEAFLKLERLRLLSRSERDGEVGRLLKVEAKAEFTKLFARAPADGWLRELFVTGLVRSSQLAAAREAIRSGMQLSTDAPFATERYRTLARCRRMVSEIEPAERAYLQAIESAPKDVDLRREIIDFYVRVDELDKAKQHLDVLVDPDFGASDEVVRSATAVRFVIAAAKGKTYREIEEILARLQSAESTEELRARAALLGRSPFRSSRVELADVLERLDSRPDGRLTDTARFRLATVYAGINRWNDAERLLRQLLRASPEDPLLIATLAGGLLDQMKFADVDPLVDRLDEIAPASFLAVGLRARLLHGRGQTDEAVKLVEEFATQIPHIADPGERFAELLAQAKGGEALQWLADELDTSSQPGAKEAIDEAKRFLDAGDHEAAVARLDVYLQQARIAIPVVRFLYAASAELLDGFGRPAAAEKVYRPYAEATGEARHWLRVSTYLAKQDRTEDALDLVEDVLVDASPVQVAHQGVATLRTASRSTADEIQRVERWILEALQKEPRSPALLVRLADLRDYQGRYDEVIELYESILEVDPENVVATNNLAWLLALHDADPRSVTLMNQLIERVGPHSVLLDTRGVVNLAVGDITQGLQDLERSAAAIPEPVVLVHLALLYGAAGEQERARESLAEAERKGFEEKRDLHPLERPLLQQLRRRVR